MISMVDMTTAPAWFERKFDFTFPVEIYPSLYMRLWGTPARLEELLSKVAHQILTAKPEDKWSIQEHAGHLADMEPLWRARLNDFVQGGKTLTAADLTNRRTHDANHNGRETRDVLRAFRVARFELLEQLKQLEAAQLAHTLVHPRLQQPMRLVDHLYFVAEHDDHHLATIWQVANA